jgi:hypothetical protein
MRILQQTWTHLKHNTTKGIYIGRHRGPGVYCIFLRDQLRSSPSCCVRAVEGRCSRSRHICCRRSNYIRKVVIRQASPPTPIDQHVRLARCQYGPPSNITTAPTPVRSPCTMFWEWTVETTRLAATQRRKKKLQHGR